MAQGGEAVGAMNCWLHIAFLVGLLASDIVAYTAVEGSDRARRTVKAAAALTALSLALWMLRAALEGGCSV